MRTDKIFCHDNDFENKFPEIKNWKTSLPQIEQFLRAYQRGEVSGEISTNGNLIKVFYDLKIICENLKGSSDEEITKFKEGLLIDKIVSYDKHRGKYCGKPYKLKRKKSLLRLAKEYLKYVYPKREDKINKILNVKIKIKTADSEILNENEYEKLRDAASSIELKAKIEILYWLGLRAEEMHNLRISDIELPSGKKQFVRVRIRDEFSKTAGRTIEMFGKQSVKIIKELLAKRYTEKAQPEDTLFKTTYNTTQNALRELGRQVLNKNVYPHLFRHTAATRLSSKLNRQQLCIWFGWRFSSPMPDRYIKRQGVDMENIIDSFEKANVEELEEQMENMKKEFEMKEREYIKRVEKIEQELFKKLNNQKVIN